MISFASKTIKVSNFSFIGKTIKPPERDTTPGKKLKAKVIWNNGDYKARIDKDLYEIANCNDLSSCKWIYSLPTNSYHTVWTKKPYFPPEQPDKNILAMTLRFWGKYYQGMTIYGKIIDGVFHQSKSKEHESNIPEVTSE